MNTSSAPPLGAILETGLYVADLARARAFYEEVLALRPMFQDHRLVAYPTGPASVLLLFQQGTTGEAAYLPGGVIPPHEGSGRLHYAFAVAAQHLQAWLSRLAFHGIPIEGEVRWPGGGHSIYFRDPDGHLVEFATPGIWANY